MKGRRAATNGCEQHHNQGPHADAVASELLSLCEPREGRVPHGRGARTQEMAEPGCAAGVGVERMTSPRAGVLTEPLAPQESGTAAEGLLFRSPAVILAAFLGSPRNPTDFHLRVDDGRTGVIPE
jgi:hypothetical protein